MEPILQSVFHINVQLNSRRFDRPQEMARDVVLRWLEAENIVIPKKGRKGGGFKAKKVYPVEVVSDGNYWAMHCEQPASNNGYPMCHIEVVLDMAGKDHRFETRLASAWPQDTKENLIRIPSFVEDIGSEVGLVDAGIPLNYGGIRIHEPNEVQKLKEYIFDMDRRLPIIVVSEESAPNAEEGMTALSVPLLASRLHGVAHTFRLSPSGSKMFTDMVTKKWSVFNGYVRCYRRGIKMSNLDELWLHHLAGFNTVSNFQGTGSGAFVHFLTQKAYEQSLEILPDRKGVPSFGEIKDRILEQRTKKLSLAPDVHERFRNFEMEKRRLLGLALAWQEKALQLQRRAAKKDGANSSHAPVRSVEVKGSSLNI